jgi:ABC-2 type transport system permease protein
MNIRRVNALFKKEIIEIIRDPRSLGLAIALPVILISLFGFALTLDIDNVPMMIWNQDKSQVSTDFILSFKNSRYFKIIGYYDSYAPLQNAIDTNKAKIALVIPKDFSKFIQSNQPAPIQVLVDGSDSNTATIVIGYVNSIVSRYNTGLITDILYKYGLNYSVPLEIRPRVWFNEDLKSKNFIIPGLIVVIMMIIAALLTSLTVAREWERGTMEQLISTPVKTEELILGKFLPYFAIGFFDLLIAIIMAQFVFKVPLKGSLGLLLLLSGLFLTGCLAQGIYISIVSKNQRMATQLAILTTFLPAFLLSGFIYPIYNMPKIIQLITFALPARYFIVILKGIYLKGVGIDILWKQVLFLSLFAFTMVSLAKNRFKKKVA